MSREGKWSRKPALIFKDMGKTGQAMNAPARHHTALDPLGRLMGHLPSAHEKSWGQGILEKELCCGSENGICKCMTWARRAVAVKVNLVQRRESHSIAGGRENQQGKGGYVTEVTAKHVVEFRGKGTVKG